MEGSGILRAVALLCLLALGFHSQFVNAGMDSTDAEPMTNHRTFTEPSTLKDLLDFLARLNESSVKAMVTQQVQDRVKAYLKSPGVLGRGIKKNFTGVLWNITELRKVLLKDPETYGIYAGFNPIKEFTDYYADVFIKWLPVLHSEMWFLYFQTAGQCARIGGGWRVLQRFGESYYTSQIHRWFTDQLDRRTVPWIPKGFNPEDLHDANVGAHIAPLTGISLYLGGPLNYAQYGLFLLSPTWHDSNLASALWFLQEFCSEVIKAKSEIQKHISDMDPGPLKSACESVSTDLKTLTELLHPLYRGITKRNPYCNRLKPEAYTMYVEWLSHNFTGMVEALRRMAARMSRWTHSALYNCEYSGPFRYGFTFRRQSPGETLNVTLPPVVTKLTASDSGSLSMLVKVLSPRAAQPISPTAPSHPASFRPPTAQQPLSSPEEPFTVRELLDLLGILSRSGLKEQIARELDRRTNPWFDLGSIPDGGVGASLIGLLEIVPQLRSVLLRDPYKYAGFSRFNPFEDSISYYVDVLAHWLPVLHSELWLLYFQTAEECVNLGGGSWHELPFGPSFHTSQLHRWLTDQLDWNFLPWIPKGFQPDDLNDANVGAHIAPLTGVYLHEGGPLNHAQSGLFLLTPWHDSNLGSAVLFLQEFCTQATKANSAFKKDLSDEQHAAMQSVCEYVSRNLMFLTDGLHPLYDGSMDTYRGRLRPESFVMYAYWLSRNLDPMKASLAHMLSESGAWSMDAFHKASTAGPLRFGFVFRDHKWEGSLRAKQPTVLFPLTGHAPAPSSGMPNFTYLRAAA